MEPRSPKLLLILGLALGLVVVYASSEMRGIGNHQGYEPLQPIAFSHRVHAGDLRIDCLYCHYAARTSRHAGIPPAGLCLNCHAHVSASFDVLHAEREAAIAEAREPRRIVSDEVRKLYRALGLDDAAQRDPALEPTPIEWVRVHHVPDFVHFDHRIHVRRGLACQECHGPVTEMERMRQDSDLSMGWCIQCHRDRPADPDRGPSPHVTTDCASCHV